MGLKEQVGSGFIDCCRQTNDRNEVEDFVAKVEEFCTKNFGCVVMPVKQLTGATKFRSYRKVKSAKAQGMWEIKISRWSPNKPFSIYVKADYRFGKFEGIDAFEAETGIYLSKVGDAWSGKYTLMS